MILCDQDSSTLTGIDSFYQGIELIWAAIFEGGEQARLVGGARLVLLPIIELVLSRIWRMPGAAWAMPNSSAN